MPTRTTLPCAALALLACAQPVCPRPTDSPPRPAATLAAPACSAPQPWPQLAPARSYRMTLVYLSGSEPFEFLLVLNDALAFKTVAALEQFLEGQPAGTAIDWDPGCMRMGHEPLLSDPAALLAFERFCASHQLRFVLHPSG